MYPVTAVTYETEDSALKERWREFMEDHLRIRPFLIEANLDKECYGNCYVSLYYPFRKNLKCRSCGASIDIGKASYKFRSFQYWLACKKCSSNNPAIVEDKPLQSSRGIRLIRWDPEAINIDFNPITQEAIYYYEIPLAVKNNIILEKKDILETIPHSFVESLRLNKSLVISPDNIFHYKRASISHLNMGLGIPRMLPVLKHIYLLQQLQKAQEMIAHEHIVPLRILFPQPSSTTSDPYSTVQISGWEERVKEEVNNWKQDASYFPIMPLPVGHQVIGGDAKALMMSDEIRLLSEHIVAGCGTPQELVFGGLSYSGSSVSMRMMENEFLGTRSDMLGLLRFIVKKVSTWMSWKAIKTGLTPFKMADDLQRAAFDLQLNMADKISEQTLLTTRDYDYQNERKQIEAESKAKFDRQKSQQVQGAEAAGEAMLIQQKYQAKAQSMMQASQGMPGMEGQPPGGEGMPPPPGGQPPAEQQPTGFAQSPLNSQTVTGGGGLDIQMMAQRVVGYINQLDNNLKYQELARLRLEHPEVYQMVTQMLYQQGSGSANLPPPEIRAPMRGPATQQV